MFIERACSVPSTAGDLTMSETATAETIRQNNEVMDLGIAYLSIAGPRYSLLRYRLTLVYITFVQNDFKYRLLL